MRKMALIILSSLFLFSCDPKSDYYGGYPVYVPVYSTLAAIQQYAVEPQRPTAEAGKIYAYGNYIFQNDHYTGIHIIDNTDHKGIKIAFLNIPLNTDIAIKANYLYANNYTDLLVFDISDPAHPQFIKRVPDVFPPVDQDYPPFTNIYFQCPDKSKGVVTRWEQNDSIPLPNCRR